MRSEMIGDIARVTVTGDPDTDPASTMQAEATAHVDNGATVIVDLAGLTFFSSSGINALLAVHRHARVNGVAVAVAAQRLVLRPLTLTGASGVLAWPFTRLCPTPWRHCAPTFCTGSIRGPVRALLRARCASCSARRAVISVLDG